MQINPEQLKRFIVESGLVSTTDIAAAEKTIAGRGEKIGQALVAAGKLKAADLKRIEAYVIGIPFVFLGNEKIEPEVLALIPEPIARTNNVVAFKRNDDRLQVAMLDVDDLPTIDFVKKKTGLKIVPCLTIATIQKKSQSRIRCNHRKGIHLSKNNCRRIACRCE